MCLNECQSPLKSDFKIPRYVDPNWKLKETDGKTRPKKQNSPYSCFSGQELVKEVQTGWNPFIIAESNIFLEMSALPSTTEFFFLLI